MGRRPCCLKEGLNRGAWTAMEDEILTQYIAVHGEGKWRDLPQRAGLRRCGKSCRLRWLNYLRPTIKRGNITPEEDDLIIRLHNLLGNRWALIAGRLPGRTDNEIKNYWNTKITKTIRLAQSASTTSTATTTPNPLPPYISDDQPQHVLVHSSSSDDDDQYNTKTKPSVVVRTKATRCTKAVVIPSLPPQLQDHVVIDPPAKKSSLKNSVGPERLSCPLMILEDDDDISNFLIDFEMDELFLSDFVNNDFMSSIALQPSCLDLSACAGTGISTSTSSTVISTTTASTSTIDDASPKSDHETLLFPEEEDAQLLHCSDMQQTMASLIDSDDLVGSIKT